jgi:hypothetical protein
MFCPPATCLLIFALIGCGTLAPGVAGYGVRTPVRDEVFEGLSKQVCGREAIREHAPELDPHLCEPSSQRKIVGIGALDVVDEAAKELCQSISFTLRPSRRPLEALDKLASRLLSHARVEELTILRTDTRQPRAKPYRLLA